MEPSQAWALFDEFSGMAAGFAQEFCVMTSEHEEINDLVDQLDAFFTEHVGPR